MSLGEKIFILALGLLIIILVAVKTLNRDDKLALLKERYEKALQGNDRNAAWEAARAYYRYQKGSELNIEDERIIYREITAQFGPEDISTENEA